MWSENFRTTQRRRRNVAVGVWSRDTGLCGVHACSTKSWIRVWVENFVLEFLGLMASLTSCTRMTIWWSGPTKNKSVCAGRYTTTANLSPGFHTRSFCTPDTIHYLYEYTLSLCPVRRKLDNAFWIDMTFTTAFSQFLVRQMELKERLNKVWTSFYSNAVSRGSQKGWGQGRNRPDHCNMRIHIWPNCVYSHA